MERLASWAVVHASGLEDRLAAVSHEDPDPSSLSDRQWAAYQTVVGSLVADFRSRKPAPTVPPPEHAADAATVAAYARQLCKSAAGRLCAPGAGASAGWSAYCKVKRGWLASYEKGGERWGRARTSNELFACVAAAAAADRAGARMTALLLGWGSDEQPGRAGIV